MSTSATSICGQCGVRNRISRNRTRPLISPRSSAEPWLRSIWPGPPYRGEPPMLMLIRCSANRDALPRHTDASLAPDETSPGTDTSSKWAKA